MRAASITVQGSRVSTLARGWPWGFLLGCGLLGCGLLGCGPSRGFVAVDLKTDLRAPFEFEVARVTLTTVERSASTKFVAFAAADFVHGVRIAEFDGVWLGAGELRVELIDNAGHVVLERPVRVSVGTATAVTVVMTRRCQDVMCPSVAGAALDACVDGRCADPRCTEETPEYCPPDSCANDSDCEAPIAPCASSACIEGRCYSIGDERLCSEDRYCDLDAGCVARDPADCDDLLVANWASTGMPITGSPTLAAASGQIGITWTESDERTHLARADPATLEPTLMGGTAGEYWAQRMAATPTGFVLFFNNHRALGRHAVFGITIPFDGGVLDWDERFVASTSEGDAFRAVPLVERGEIIMGWRQDRGAGPYGFAIGRRDRAGALTEPRSYDVGIHAEVRRVVRTPDGLAVLAMHVGHGHHVYWIDSAGTLLHEVSNRRTDPLDIAWSAETMLLLQEVGGEMRVGTQPREAMELRTPEAHVLATELVDAQGTRLLPMNDQLLALWRSRDEIYLARLDAHGAPLELRRLGPLGSGGGAFEAAFEAAVLDRSLYVVWRGAGATTLGMARVCF